jgi:hypothetical protein
LDVETLEARGAEDPTGTALQHFADTDGEIARFATNAGNHRVAATMRGLQTGIHTRLTDHYRRHPNLAPRERNRP